MKHLSLFAAGIGVVLTVSVGTASAVPVIAYEWTEGGPQNGVLSPHVSQHGTRGPVLADDFIPIVTGRVVQIDWWGSAPRAVGAPDLWEITFHNDANGVPAAQLPGGGISQHFVNAGGVDADGDGVFAYTAAWNPQDLFVVAGATYWFSAANAEPCLNPGPAPGPGCLAGWQWAYAGGAGPTVGAEAFNTVNSIGVGPNGGPHFGPWGPNLLADGSIDAGDFAFRIWVEAPEPATAALLALALIAWGYTGRRYRR